MCSEYIVEDMEWGDLIPYSQSNIHKIAMPRYYDELSDLEKSAIIYRKFRATTVKGNAEDNIYENIESYFYIPSSAEIMVEFIIYGDGGDEYRYSSFPDNPVIDGFTYLSAFLRKKQHKDGSPGEYFTTTTRRNAANTVINYYITTVGNDGSSTGTEHIIYSGHNGGTNRLFNKDSHVNSENKTYSQDNPESLGRGYFSQTSGVVPFCDIKGDTTVTQDSDGYWYITDPAQPTTVNITVTWNLEWEPPQDLKIQLFKDNDPVTDKSESIKFEFNEQEFKNYGRISFTNMDPLIEYNIKIFKGEEEFIAPDAITRMDNLPNSVDYLLEYITSAPTIV